MSNRRYLMCAPTYFDVTYKINYWMDADTVVDRDRAQLQWETLRQTHLDFGHQVDLIPSCEGLPDMVFTANAGIVDNDRVVIANFRDAERHPESKLFDEWFSNCGFQTIHPTCTNEGEGDFLRNGNLLIGGSGFRSDAAAANELIDLLGIPTISLTLCDERFYHLDTAMTILDNRTVAYVPQAFTRGGIAALHSLFDQHIEVSLDDAAYFALNAVSDGQNVIVAAQAKEFRSNLEALGYLVAPIDMSEFLKAGGGAKCCTLVTRY